jgi:Leucine-rich repeat (LRR) protein
LLFKKLFCKTETLDLSYNLLETTIDHLQHLHFLQNLNLSNNRLHDVSDFNARVGNIRSLDLSYNELITTDGLSRLYSLITLNLSSNKLDSIKNIESLGSLPCLENLWLKNNPLTRMVDYRLRVFAVFHNRAKDVKDFLENFCSKILFFFVSFFELGLVRWTNA